MNCVEVMNKDIEREVKDIEKAIDFIIDLEIDSYVKNKILRELTEQKEYLESLK